MSVDSEMVVSREETTARVLELLAVGLAAGLAAVAAELRKTKTLQAVKTRPTRRS